MFYATKIVVTPLEFSEIESCIMADQIEVTSAINSHLVEENMKLISHSSAALGAELISHTLFFSKP